MIKAGVIGFPINHSKSPTRLMTNTKFGRLTVLWKMRVILRDLT